MIKPLSISFHMQSKPVRPIKQQNIGVHLDLYTAIECHYPVAKHRSPHSWVCRYEYLSVFYTSLRGVPISAVSHVKDLKKYTDCGPARTRTAVLHAYLMQAKSRRIIVDRTIFLNSLKFALCCI